MATATMRTTIAAALTMAVIAVATQDQQSTASSASAWNPLRKISSAKGNVGESNTKGIKFATTTTTTVVAIGMAVIAVPRPYRRRLTNNTAKSASAWTLRVVSERASSRDTKGTATATT